MTISILTYDAKTGTYGGAACTGSLCVGGWVLRGDAESGLSASQGSAPSTLWGTRSLELMRGGTSAADAVARLTGADSGRGHRQMAALDPSGGVGHFTGADSVATAGARAAENVVVSGNMLSGEAVLDACIEGYLDARGAHAERLLAALTAAERAGGDSRGLLSAALLVVGPDMAPLTLRIDHSETPLAALQDLYRRSQSSPYADWLDLVPTLNAPDRAPG
ncbi:DUF1028 domain-containing protein [Pelagovum pacificum]|uniref:DUF1028 domain-containing protein n=1 Tax=Pelagovum pacificum TaxID=2588711 RepID=A0A5C5GGD5_9RHOB|nr:DUF1028 domain-containing protein [Pelagovum pacificum]QQA43792.1 DUF1028 domain-containing protein [Pelagovum pacificum]TNY33079.1 DUF1028 domain-containing protein [Pelagovum pacificum]